MGRFLSDSVNVQGYEICCDSLWVTFLTDTPDTLSNPGLTKVGVQMTIEIDTWSHDTHHRLGYGVGEVYEHLYLRKTGATWKVVRWEEESLARGPLLCVCGTIGGIMWLWRPT
jgi:hypothetical protein